MIAPRLLRHALLSAAIFSGAASAVGLGEINLHSRIGETLRADIPVIAGGESLDAACFTLGPVPNADLPVITSARTRLVRTGQDYRLILTGKAIDEPIALISLRVGCGMDLHREYVLLPAPPPSAHDSEPAAAPMPREAQPRRPRAERFSENESSSGTPPDQASAKPRRERAEPRPTAKPKKPLPRDTLANIAGSKDRIVLGAALDDLPPPSAGDPLAPINELDERLLKMETTLHLLNQEVDKLNSAVALSAESRAAREKLQDMQARQSSPGIPAAAPQAPPRAASSLDNWLELLIGLLLGGSVSAGIAHLVSRRHVKSQKFDAPPPRIAKPRNPTKV